MAVAGGPEEVDEMVDSCFPTDQRVIVDGEPGEITMRYTHPLPDEGSSIRDGLPEGVISCTEETIVTASTPLPDDS